MFRTFVHLTQKKFINSFAPDDISELNHDVYYGMMNDVTTLRCPHISSPMHLFVVSLYLVTNKADITNLDYYDATFHNKDGLYLYRGTELVHYTPKSLDDTSWTLPLQRPLVYANAVLLSLPFDKKFVHFSHASFDSPSIYIATTCIT